VLWKQTATRLSATGGRCQTGLGMSYKERQGTNPQTVAFGARQLHPSAPYGLLDGVPEGGMWSCTAVA
jgi:hypothetical protein